MFKIIAALAFLSGLIDRVGVSLGNLADNVWDVRDRIVGAAISTASEGMYVCQDSLASLKVSHRLDVDKAGDTLSHNMQLAHEEYTATLQQIGRRTEAVELAIYAKQRVLRDKRAKLRGLLSE